MGHTQPVGIKNKKCGEQGFTLLEVFFALAIFSFGLLALATLQVTSIKGNSSARMHTEGYTWAVDQIEWMITLSYDDDELSAGAHERDADPYLITWNVQDNAPVTDTKTIQVRVSDMHNRAKRVTLNYIKAR